ncbi:MAG: ABC transporter permease [Bacillus sp. (in: Bacteria)]|nr:ABC transporter permease [Bacillus sp. (in: firmicutes)]
MVIMCPPEPSPRSFVNAIRALLYEGSVGNDIWIALAWCVGIMVIAYFFASKVFKRQLG